MRCLDRRSFLSKVNVEWAMFGPPFLGPSPTGACRVDPKEDCMVVQGAAEGDCHSNPRLQRPLALYRLTCRFWTRGSQSYL